MSDASDKTPDALIGITKSALDALHAQVKHEREMRAASDRVLASGVVIPTKEYCAQVQERDSLRAQLQEAQAKRDLSNTQHYKLSVEFAALEEKRDRYREALQAILLHGQHPSHDYTWVAYTLDLVREALGGGEE